MHPRRDNDVVLEVRAARPGTWTCARQHVAFDDLLAQLSSEVAKHGGRPVNSVGSFGRLCTTVRIKSSARSATKTPLQHRRRDRSSNVGGPTPCRAVCKDG